MSDLPILALWPLGVYAVMSVVTFAAFGLDKRAATRGTRRTPESTLHALELLGGWPGALVARNVFRHKRAKARYMLVLWIIVAVHVVFWAGWWFGLSA
jgi:uncharacterized membrane protein YsdA (DUF1294 family)